MKNILKIAGLVLIVSLFFSCEEDKAEEMTVAERINAFEADLDNGDYANIADNFHPEMTSYETYQDGDVLNTGHIRSSYAPFDFSDPSTSGSGTVTATGSFANNVVSDGTYTASMKEDGDNNWKILSIVISAGTDQEIYGVSR